MKKLRGVSISLAVVLSLGGFGCGSDDDSSVGEAPVSNIQCWWERSSTAETTLRCGAEPPPGAREVVRQLELEARETVPELNVRGLEDFDASDWQRIVDTRNADEFIIVPDEDLLRQTRLWAQNAGVAENIVDDLFRVRTSASAVPKCRFKKAWRIPALLCS